MTGRTRALTLAGAAFLFAALTPFCYASDDDVDSSEHAEGFQAGGSRHIAHDLINVHRRQVAMQLGVRPCYLVAGVRPGRPKDELPSCANVPSAARTVCVPGVFPDGPATATHDARCMKLEQAARLSRVGGVL